MGRRFYDMGMKGMVGEGNGLAKRRCAEWIHTEDGWRCGDNLTDIEADRWYGSTSFSLVDMAGITR